MSTNPWDKDFTPAAVDENVIKDIQSALAPAEQVVQQTVSTAENVVPEATQAVESVVPTVENAVTGTAKSAIPTISPTNVTVPTTISANPITDLTGSLESVIEAAAKGSAKSALQSLAPTLEAELAKEFQATVEKVVDRATGGGGVEPTPNLEDFIHADARSRAFRTLLVGLGVAVLTGIGTAAGQLIGADWSTHNGQVAAITIAVGAIATSLGTYFTRLVSEPQVTKPLTAHLPSKAESK